ncbi:MAG: BrnA antitoxin family protein [Deltaproteobacteria bacterium]|nr:BrnA antitoxin family protein [Deltaproteobacteria bacterium]
MSAKNTQKKSRTDWKKMRTLDDKAIDFSDVPALDKNFFRNAELRLPQNKSTITIRLDHDVLAWLKSKGKGYQTRVNAILRMFMQAQKG